MSERDLRRRNILSGVNRRSTSSGRVTKPSPPPSPASRRKIRPEKIWRNVNVLKRTKSEPLLWKADGREVAEEEEEGVGVLYRPLTCFDIFSPTESPRKCPGGVYNKDAKVVVNVTVEGSPGPIRAMVKLGSNVDDTIRLVVKKYNEQGRTPHLDKNAASKEYELHHSYFSLESFSKSDLIADVGTRSFYLRRISSNRENNGKVVNTLSEDLAAGNQLASSTLSSIPISIKKIIRRTLKVCDLFGCIPCTN